MSHPHEVPLNTIPPGRSINPIVGRDLLLDAGIRLLRQCLIGRGLKFECLMTSFEAGNSQHFVSRPKSFSGLLSVSGPFVAGRVYPGYTLRVVSCLVERIATFLIFLKLTGHETKFLLIAATRSTLLMLCYVMLCY